MKLLKRIVLLVGCTTLNALAMIPPSSQKDTPPVTPLTIKIINNDPFCITLQAEYTQSPPPAGFPPANPYICHKIKGFQSTTIELVRQQKKSRLKKLVGIKLFHDVAGTFTLSEQECAAQNYIQIVLAHNTYMRAERKKVDTV